MKVRLTHRGWVGICPCYISDNSPVIVPAHWVFMPLMWLSLSWFWLMFTLIELIDSEYEPGFPILIASRVEPPIEVEVNDG